MDVVFKHETVERIDTLVLAFRPELCMTSAANHSPFKLSRQPCTVQLPLWLSIDYISYYLIATLVILAVLY